MPLLLKEHQTPTHLQCIDKPFERDGFKYIGLIKGTAAEWSKPTRNGHWYVKELWENVIRSEDYKEGMETKTLLGEIDHPEDRVEPLGTKAAITLLLMELKEDGTVYCEFGILNTTQGRELKGLSEGCRLGVSSRGLGEEITRDGTKIIDPDTYVFYGFDAVVTPAVQSARPIVEKKSFVQMIKDQLEGVTQLDELQNLKVITQGMKQKELAPLMEAFNKKEQTLSSGNTTEESNLDLKQEIKNLKSQISSGNTQRKKILELLNQALANSNTLRQLTTEARKEVTTLTDQLLECVTETEEYEKRITVLEARCGKLNNKNKSLTDEKEILESSNSGLLEDLSKANALIERYVTNQTNSKAVLEDKENQIKELQLKVTSLTESLDKSKRTLTESKQKEIQALNESLTRTRNTNQALMERYIATKCEELGISPSTFKKALPKKYTLSIVDKHVEALKKQANNLRNLNFTYAQNLIGEASMESRETNLPPEEAKSFRFLQEAAKNRHKKEGI